MFGSLLASYVLGFITFAAAYLQTPAAGLVILPKAKTIPGTALVKDGSLDLEKMANLLSVIGVEDGEPHTNLILQIIVSWKFLPILQHFLISFLFSIFTALLYVNFHQSILHLARDRSKSSWDFLIAILIGISFGFSMIFPFSVVFWVGALTVLVLIRKRAELVGYWVHIGEEVAKSADLAVPSESNASQRAERDRKLNSIIAEIKAPLATTDNPVLKSWKHAGRYYVWAAGLTMTIVPFLWFLFDFVRVIIMGGEVASPILSIRNLLLINVTFCAGLCGFLFSSLLKATRDMPSKEDSEEDDKLETDLTNLLTPVRNSRKSQNTNELREA
jgi:hypothetical protein